MSPAPPNFSDPRLAVGAYVTDGDDLYEVTGRVKTSGIGGSISWRIKVENCRNLARIDFLPEKILASFELVRAAPTSAPDFPPDI
jgi:hypothetical protein